MTPPWWPERREERDDRLLVFCIFSLFDDDFALRTLCCFCFQDSSSFSLLNIVDDDEFLFLNRVTSLGV